MFQEVLETHVKQFKELLSAAAIRNNVTQLDVKLVLFLSPFLKADFSLLFLSCHV